jgi:Protein of unknown function (DUF3024)
VAFGGPRPTQSERMIRTEPSPEGTSRQTVNGLLHEAGTTGRPLAGSGRLPNRGQRRDSLRREAGLSAAPRLAGDGIAKFTYVGTQRECWRLYCQHRDLRWHSYQALPAASSFAKLLDEVDADPTGIFWG